MELLGDFHIHSTFSDGKLTIPELVDFFGSRGFGVIAITDHLCERKTLIGKAARVIDHTLTPESFPKYLETIQEEGERAWRQYRMIVIPGFETTKNSVINSRSAHMLALGVEKFIDADGDVYDIAKNIKDAGGTVIGAHPVFSGQWEKQTYHLWNRKEELSEVIDAWEGTRALRLLPEVLESGLPVIANSDLHRPNHISSWKTVVDSERHPEAILQAIRRQKVRFEKYIEKVAVPVSVPMILSAS